MLDFIHDGPSRKGVKAPGLGLVIKYTDPTNKRRQLVKLSPKGESLVKLIKQTIYGWDQDMATSHGLHIQHPSLMEAWEWSSNVQNQLQSFHET